MPPHLAHLAAQYAALLRWHELRSAFKAGSHGGGAWPLPPTRAEALAAFEAGYREMGSHRAWPPEADAPTDDDIGLSEHGHGLKWLREELKAGGNDGYSLEREPPRRHAPFQHGPYGAVHERAAAAPPPRALERLWRLGSRRRGRARSRRRAAGWSRDVVGEN